MMKATWEKIVEYASMPVHGTLSRKLRNGVALQINEGRVHAAAVLFLGEEFVRITEEEDGKMVNSYYEWSTISTVRTLSPKEGSGK
jgi:hypothetical protein